METQKKPAELTKEQILDLKIKKLERERAHWIDQVRTNKQKRQEAARKAWLAN